MRDRRGVIADERVELIGGEVGYIHRRRDDIVIPHGGRDEFLCALKSHSRNIKVEFACEISGIDEGRIERIIALKGDRATFRVR